MNTYLQFSYVPKRNISVLHVELLESHLDYKNFYKIKQNIGNHSVVNIQITCRPAPIKVYVLLT